MPQRASETESKRSTGAIFLFALAAVTVAAMGYFALAQGIDVFRRKTVVLEMSWKRGNEVYGPNFVHLESPCQSSQDPGCYCAMDFTVTVSKDFGDYIQSFGSGKVPVRYRIDYDVNRKLSGIGLESVGAWPATRFNTVEKSLSSGTRSSQGQPPSGVLRGKTPDDCLPASAR